MRRPTPFAVAMATLLVIALPATVRAQDEGVSRTAPAHLTTAVGLVVKLRYAAENYYGGGKRHIDWDAEPAAARTVCSSFTTLLLQHTYGWTNDQIREWLGAANPEAFQYYNAITAKNRFRRIVHVDRIRPGDILAVKYTDHHVSRNGVEDTGHVMLVASAPQRIAAHAPLVKGTTQYVVDVIDSSASGHGVTDTRYRRGGSFTGGIGRGVFRIYADSDGRIGGYSWSDGARSPFYTRPNRILVAGRLRPSANGAPEGGSAPDDNDER